MKRLLLNLFIAILLLSSCAHKSSTDLQSLFQNPPESAKPWTFWFWIKAAVSEEGITADLEAMKANGFGGAYLITLQEAENPPLYEPPIEQLSPEWWKMIEYTFNEADRLGLKLGMHSCDGFAVAGGPWITPELSMQKVVWSEIDVTGNQIIDITLPQPETIEDYYKDIAVFAYPSYPDAKYNTSRIKPTVSSDITNENLDFLSDPENTKEFKTYDEGYIQYQFKEPFTCRTIHIKTRGFTYAAHHLIVKSSMDGIHFDSICRMEPPRNGWQDYEEDATYSIPATTAKYFRFYYSTQGIEPGSEDMDIAKWSPRLKVQGIQLSGKPAIHQYEAKNGVIWRIGKRTNNIQLPDSLCISIKEMIDLTKKVYPNGHILWEAPEGDWTILRIGHTSTGHTNYIGGKGKGLECDKFSLNATTIQFENWFGKVFDEIDSALAHKVLKSLLIDSWECGSQNWSSVFRKEFKYRRGYDIYPYLAVYTGLPVENADFSEKVLYDIRKTIDEMITNNFYRTMHLKAIEKDCEFASESIAPVMVSDAMQHYKKVDIPMAEFWNNSPSHDKPTDVLDAVSAAIIYEKQIVQAEGFTTLRMDWNEHPAMLKPLLDRNWALGINKLVFHTYTHNPWMDRQPGMSMNTVGLYYQRDQTWWKQSKAWVDYIQRAQALLQQGKPVVDIAVFTGEDYPRRALTPDRLVKILPGLFGHEVLERENTRLRNEGVPQLERPYSVKSSKNTFDPANWIDPLRGYKYTSINKDALLNLAKVEDGDIILPGGQKFKVLVIPGNRKASPNSIISKETCEKISELAKAGATIILEPMTAVKGGLIDKSVEEAAFHLYNQDFAETNSGIEMSRVGKGRIIKAPYLNESLKEIGIERDVEVFIDGQPTNNIAWTHRKLNNDDIYFISNQEDTARIFYTSLRTSGKIINLYNPATGKIAELKRYAIKDGRTVIPLKFEPNQSMFFVLQKESFIKRIVVKPNRFHNWRTFYPVDTINSTWTVQFDPEKGGPALPYQMKELTDWTQTAIDSIIYYSGTAIYNNSFTIDNIEKTDYWLDLGKVHHIAEVFVNGENCGITWTYPYRVNITDALKEGNNELTIEVTNTWKNRIIGDNTIFKTNPVSWTTAPFRIEGQPVVESGLEGDVIIKKVIF